MDSGALYDLQYGNAPEFFSKYRSQKALSILALVRLRAAIYSDMGKYSFHFTLIIILTENST